MSDIIKKVEELSIALVMGDLSDLQELGSLYKQFDELSSTALNESQDLVAKAASATGKLIEDIIMNEVPDREAAIEVISGTVSAIQAIVVMKRPIKEVKFPKALGLSEAGETEPPAAISDQEGQEAVPDTVAENSQADKVADEKSYELNDPELAADFISEAREHLHETEVQLLTLEDEPQNEDALGSVYRAFHTIKGVAGFLALEEISQLAHETESLLDLARKGDILLTGPAIDVTFESVDALKQMIDDVEAALSNNKVVSRAELLSKLLPAIESAASGGGRAPVAEEAGVEAAAAVEVSQEVPETTVSVSEEIVAEELEQEPEEEEVVTEEPEVTEVAVPAAPQEKQAAKAPSSTTHVRETIKIEAERLDMLVDTIGELVIAESMVSQDSNILEKASPRVARNLSHLDKITRELQEIGMSLRLMPVRPVFERMARLTRDLAKKSGKKIRFTMSGEDTEVDKGIVERISDPLTHMIRNAVDHGIEASPEERRTAGKPEAGHIELRAFHRSSSILIEVADDGRGLDREAILAKARERGIITDEQSMPDQEVFKLIFRAGLSTAKKVTNVSGRGVGMDVVTRNIQSLRGQVRIDSLPGKGTTFSMRLPLTLAIIEGMVISVAGERYIVPTLSVVESLRPTKEELSAVLQQGEMVSVRGQLLPLYRLSRLFGISGAEEDPTRTLVVIIEHEGVRAGLMIDSIIGQQQTVIKSLGSILNEVTGISGATIMSDGRVGLILDPGEIIRLATS